MSEQQHSKDEAAGLPHHQAKGAKGHGGACLNRHIPGTPKDTAGNSCSHRWQSFLATQDRATDYNWPKYQALAGKNAPQVPTAYLKGSGFPPWYKPNLKAPAKHEWDVTKDNFSTKCYIPYWHEAHHAIPNSVLRSAIADASKGADDPQGVARVIRRGLLKEKYNLNHRSNMITLPMDMKISAAIRLPVHRQTAAHREHNHYSAHAMELIFPVFDQLKDDIAAHKERDYKNAKNYLEDVSALLIEEIRTSMGPGNHGSSLDQLFGP